MRTIKLLHVLSLAFLVLISCGKDDKNNEYVEDNSTKQQETKQREKESVDDKTESISGDTLKTSRQEKDYTKQDNSFKDEKPVAVISPVEANDYVGKTVTVKGFVADVYQSEKVAYLNFVEKYPRNPFTAVIFASQFEDFPDIVKFKGRDVEVTGRVSFFKGKPQIIINKPSQIK